MQQFEWIHAAAGNRAGNYCQRLLKFSDGFRRKIYGILSWRQYWRVQRPVAGG